MECPGPDVGHVPQGFNVNLKGPGGLSASDSEAVGGPEAGALLDWGWLEQRRLLSVPWYVTAIKKCWGLGWVGKWVEHRAKRVHFEMVCAVIR
eukprot:1088871-Rhodomonas_salina.2